MVDVFDHKNKLLAAADACTNFEIAIEDLSESVEYMLQTSQVDNVQAIKNCMMDALAASERLRAEVIEHNADVIRRYGKRN